MLDLWIKSALQNAARVFPIFAKAKVGFYFKMARVSVFIDGANFLYGIRSINKRYTDFKFDFEKFIKEIVGERELVDVFYYNASLKQDLNPGLFRKQQQF